MSEVEKREKKEIIISENRDFKGVWIPERLYTTRKFTPNEKFLLIEIYSLTKKKNRECFANNKHFADFVGLKENTIQKMMLKFENSGYITRSYEYRENTKEIERRTIKLTQKFYDDFINETEKSDSFYDDMENNQWGSGFESREYIEKNPYGGGLKVGDKNNNLSDTDLNINSKANSFFTKKVRERKKVINQDEFINHIHDVVKQMEEEVFDEYQADNVEQFFIYFVERYAQVFGKRHPFLKEETLYGLAANITDHIYIDHGEFETHFEPLVSDDPEDCTYESVVDLYFETEFKEKCDYSMAHFCQKNVLTKLMGHDASHLWFTNES